MGSRDPKSDDEVERKRTTMVTPLQRGVVVVGSLRSSNEVGGCQNGELRKLWAFD